MMDNSPQQLPLDFSPEIVFNLDDLVITKSNAAAYELIERWPHWGRQPIALLAGPSGSGKTHFASVWQGKTEAFIADRNNLRQAIEKANEGHSILIENIDAGPFNETELFHLFNTIKQLYNPFHKISLLLTARNLPLMWDLKLEDLISRMKSVTFVTIDPPDDILLIAVLTKLFSDKQIIVSRDIIKYIVERIERSLSMACKLVDVADRLALSQKRKISKPLINEALLLLQKEESMKQKISDT